MRCLNKVLFRLLGRVALGFALSSPAILVAVAANAAEKEAEAIRDQLSHRWFEVEVIVFERLDVLELNTVEQLVRHEQRTWPHNLRDMQPMGTPDLRLQGPLDADGTGTKVWRIQANELLPNPIWCLGYPEIPADRSPSVTEFSDETFAAQEAERLTLEAEAERLAEEELAQVEVDALNSPQSEQDGLNGSDQILIEVEPTPEELFAKRLASYEETLLASSYQWLDTTTMDNDLKALNRQSTLRPILHGRWRQPVPDRNTPQPIYVESAIDERSPLTLRGFPKVNGFIAVTVGRYLHFAPTLWYHADNLGAQPIVMPNLSLESAAMSASSEPYMELSESRRLRSETLHYLDHPKLGVIVRIDPITIEPALIDEYLALEATQEGIN